MVLLIEKKSQICNSTIMSMQYQTKVPQMPESPIRKLVPYQKLPKKGTKSIT
jgi:hypothetical protein